MVGYDLFFRYKYISASRLRAVPPFRRSPSRESKITNREKHLERRIDVTQRAPRGTPTSIFFTDFLLTRAKDFAEKEGLLVVNLHWCANESQHG